MKKLIKKLFMSCILALSTNLSYGTTAGQYNEAMDLLNASDIVLPSKENASPQAILEVIQQIEIAEKSGNLTGVGSFLIEPADLVKIVVGTIDGKKFSQFDELSAQAEKLWQDTLLLDLQQFEQQQNIARTSSYFNDFLQLATENPVITGALITSLLAAAGLYGYRYYTRTSSNVQDVPVDSKDDKASK